MWLALQLALTALQSLAGALVVSTVAFGWFVYHDVKVWLDNKPETETASTEIRRWMRHSKAHTAALTGAILSPLVLVVYLLGHFPLGWW